MSEPRALSSSQARIAVVTGGGSGIGAAVVAALAEDGFVVVSLSRSGAFGSAPQAAHLSLSCDVSDFSSVEKAHAHILQAYGATHALVNCAGITAFGLIEDLPLEDLTRVISVNLFGVIYTCRVFAQDLQTTRGCIVNVSSGLATRPLPGRAVYAATKGAIESLTRSLAMDYGPHGVRVNAVAPSVVRTGIWRTAGLDEEAQQRMLRERGATYPLGRIGEPEDVADAVRFLASERARWITGCVMPVDGGSTLGSIGKMASPGSA